MPQISCTTYWWRVFLVARKRTRIVTVVKKPKRKRTETFILESMNREEGQEERLPEHQFLLQVICD